MLTKFISFVRGLFSSKSDKKGPHSMFSVRKLIQPVMEDFDAGFNEGIKVGTRDLCDYLEDVVTVQQLNGLKKRLKQELKNL